MSTQSKLVTLTYLLRSVGCSRIWQKESSTTPINNHRFQSHYILVRFSYNLCRQIFPFLVVNTVQRTPVFTGVGSVHGLLRLVQIQTSFPHCACDLSWLQVGKERRKVKSVLSFTSRAHWLEPVQDPHIPCENFSWPKCQFGPPESQLKTSQT